jgi:hypothetical protein
VNAGPDPVLARRARIARLTEVGQRVGYGLLGLAVVLFVIGAVGSFTGPVVVAITVCLTAGSAVLAPAIVFGFAVKAADRQDRERDQQRRRPGRGGPQ